MSSSFMTPWAVTCQAPLSMRFFPGKNTGVSCQFPSPGDLPNPGIKPRSPTLQAESLPAELQVKPICHKKEQNFAICSNIDGLGGYHAKKMKPDRKTNIV